jgi:hypothetical protein
MGTTTKKFVSVALSLTTFVWLTGVAIVPVASAQSVADLQAQIAALLAQINALTAQLNAQSGGAGASVSCSFTRDLTVGSTGADVKCLQQWLNSVGFQVAASGAGSPGNETTTFGPATRAALAKMQAAKGISPAAGYFGPKTRSFIVAMSSGGTGTGTGSGGTTPPPVISGQVTVIPGSNPGGSIISGAAQVPVLNFKVSNGTNGSVWVTSAKFKKTGVVSDSSISNAYLSLGNNIVAQYISLSGGVVAFSGNLFEVPAGQTVDVWLRMDISSGTSNGNTIGFALDSASDLTVSAGTVGGSFPVSGGNFITTIVTNPSLASLTGVAYQGVAGEVDAGSSSFRAGALALTVQNSSVKLQSVRFTVSGSINANTDLKNLVLKVDGTQVGTAAGLTVDSKAFFDLSANAPVLSTGSHQIEVFADVLGTPFRNFKLEILRPFDWVLTDTQYNTNISGGTPSGTATSVNVRQGVITSSLDASTPTGNIARGGTNVTVAKFAIRASGEAVKLKWMPFKITKTGGAAWGPSASATVIDASIRNISIYADDGGQLGTTINTPSSCTYGTAEQTATTYICSFGSPSSNINYIIPANTTRVFSLRFDVQANGDVTSLKGSLVPPSGTSGFTGSNVEGQISFQTSAAPGGTIDGSVLSISTSPFQATQNTAFAAQTYVGGASNSPIASFSLSASSAEGVNVSNVTVQTSADVNLASGGGLRLQNLVVKVGSTSWNYTIPTISPSTSYTFQPPTGIVTVPSGGSVKVDVYADILTNSSSSTFTAPMKLVGAVGVGVTTNTNQTLRDSGGTAVSTSNPVSGQNTTIAGTGSLTATVDTSVPPSQQIVLGATGASLGQFRFQAGNNEDVKIQDLIVTASSTATTSPATFKNLTLWDGSGQVGTGTSLSGSLGAFTSSFHFATPLLVAKNQTKVYLLKGDVATFTESSDSHNSIYQFKVATGSDVTAFGSASNQSVSVGGSFPLVANQQTTLRTKLTASMAVLGQGAGRARTATDDIGTLTMNVDPAFGAEFEQVTVKLSGAAINFTTTTIVTVDLVDSDTGLSVATATSSVAASTPTATVTLNPTDYLITAGQSKTYKIRVDSSIFANAANTSDSLSVQIVAAGDLVWATQGNTSTENLSLQAKDVPITFTVSYE